MVAPQELIEYSAKCWILVNTDTLKNADCCYTKPFPQILYLTASCLSGVTGSLIGGVYSHILFIHRISNLFQKKSVEHLVETNIRLVPQLGV